MLRQMSNKQFIEWQVYASLEPFDETRQDYRIASIVAAVLNVHRGKGRKATTVDEARLKFGDESSAPKQTVQEQIAIGQMMAAMYNAKEEVIEEKKRLADDRRKSRDSVRKPSSRR